MQRIGLYYPYIRCRAERRLKLTALYWPKLARAVPEGYPVADSDVTDQADSHGTHGWDAQSLARALLRADGTRPAPEESLEQAIGLLSLRLVVPQDLDAVPVETIVRIRTRRQAELDAFTDAVNAVATELRGSLGGSRTPGRCTSTSTSPSAGPSNGRWRNSGKP
ncbi:DUF6236 family protein [Streptomyces sp. NPDC004284]|uniref:DUF6236 family protein n=1 Tax=Streptomyces sp. NPDC004284 TaxID=3364695 RepID=UPI0036C3724B